jgi:hypothetical protein
MTDSYLCARASGDATYLRWVKERFIHVYKEPPNVDFVQTLDSFVQYFERRKNVPSGLNWLLRKFDL